MVSITELARQFTILYFAWRADDSFWGLLEGCNRRSHRAWNCCDVHRRLKREQYAFQAAAKAFDVGSVGDILSQKWFEDLAERYQFELSVTDRPPNWIEH